MNTLTRFAKDEILKMLKQLAPKVYDERNNVKCVQWVINNILFSSQPDMKSIKGDLDDDQTMRHALIQDRKRDPIREYLIAEIDKKTGDKDIM